MRQGNKMADDGDTTYPKYVFYTFFILVGAASLFIIKFYILAILGAIILAYIFYPLYRKMARGINKNLAAFLTVAIVVLMIIIPLIFAANALFDESLQFFRTVRDLDLTKTEALASVVSDDIAIQQYITDVVTKMSLGVAKSASDFVVALPGKIISLFIMLFAMFYLLKEGKDVAEKLSSYIPLKESHRANIGKRMNGVLYATLYGTVIIAFLQGVLGAIGFWVFGVESPILWGMVMTILAMIPLIGTYIVWLPAALFKILIGDTFNGFGLLLYGALIVSTIDNILRPKLISGKGSIHPVLVLLGVLGGFKVFGLIGLVVGPIILSIFVVFIEIYALERT